MRSIQWFPVVGLLFCSGLAHAQYDILTPYLETELAEECAQIKTFSFCVSALQLHGQGKDEKALETLNAGAPSIAREHYKMAQTRPKEAFWKLVATAGAPPTDCGAVLSETLDLHFALRPGDLAAADDDAAKNSFLALADLLRAVPDGFAACSHDRPPCNRITIANVYRTCFSDPDLLFATLKHKLGR